MRIGYVQVSTTDQSPDLQSQALAADGCERIFCDIASGTSATRPELARALDMLRPGDHLVVWKLDRLGRSLPDLIQLGAQIEAKGADLVSLTDRIDTSSAGSRLLFRLLGAISDFERSLVRERTLAGLAEARRKGRTGGRPKAMTDKDLAAARALIVGGHSVREAAGRIGVSVPTLYRYLRQ
ncbi:DNA invertase [Camelimonas fluminis]|uniref:Recombinase family protein n=1 Tax=Camelimonas fluminis TaxID=1576911 RepID=A0ABV7UDN0_9HYPH|nr:DNA invertase [Camelimonas fluminis]